MIGALLESIHRQTYPAHLIDVYVAADNCTDNTAQVAREHRAFVVERFDRGAGGKGLRPQLPVFQDRGHEGA